MYMYTCICTVAKFILYSVHVRFLCFPKSDIQEFYEATLMDGSKSVTQKTMETLEVASKWEQQTYATPMRPDNSPVSPCNNFVWWFDINF